MAKVKAEETQAIADDAQRDLDEALPALEMAIKVSRGSNNWIYTILVQHSLLERCTKMAPHWLTCVLLCHCMAL